MRYLIVVMLCTICLSVYSAPCSTFEDPLDRLACYDRLETCRTIADSDERLACFDGAYNDDTVPADVPGIDAEADQPASEIVVDDADSESTISVANRLDSAPIETQKTTQEAIPQTTRQTTPEARTEITSHEAAEDEAFPIKTLNRSFSREAGADSKDQKAAEPAKPKIDTSIEKVEHNHLQLAYLTLANGQVWKEINRSGFRYRVGAEVTISKGVLGSSNLHADGMTKHVKVTRIR